MVKSDGRNAGLGSNSVSVVNKLWDPPTWPLVSSSVKWCISNLLACSRILWAYKPLVKKYLFRNNCLFEDKEPGAPAVWRQTGSPECVLTYPCLGHVWNYSKHFNLSILLAALYAGLELRSAVRFQSCILGSWTGFDTRPRDGLLLTVLMTEQLWHQKSSLSLSRRWDCSLQVVYIFSIPWKRFSFAWVIYKSCLFFFDFGVGSLVSVNSSPFHK